ncbi:MAG TPA: hypothetical protein VFJ58_22850 [Armatimonadota bacterium]|nr:hypothetical protein [Armatimonadota bacterium]
MEAERLREVAEVGFQREIYEARLKARRDALTQASAMAEVQAELVEALAKWQAVGDGQRVESEALSKRIASARVEAESARVKLESTQAEADATWIEAGEYLVKVPIAEHVQLL